MHIDVHGDAVNDLKELRTKDPRAAATVLAAIQQLQADPDAIDKLTQHGDNHVGAFRLNVKRWQEARRKADLWRFRALDTPATSCRVVYGYHWQTRQLCILAVVHKDAFDYDDLTSPLSQRILAAWRSI